MPSSATFSSPQPDGTRVAYRLAACAEMLFPNLPFLDRVRRIHDHGLEVEIWDWGAV